MRALAAMLREAGEEIVILYGERLLDGPGGAGALLALAEALDLATVGRCRPDRHSGGRQRSRPARGRHALVRGPGPDRSAARRAGRDTPAIAEALRGGDLVALYLLGVDPLRDLPDRGGWDEALDHATTVIAHAAFLTEGIREHATVVFPAEAAAEKEGTVTHPDGRVQRLRPAIARQGRFVPSGRSSRIWPPGSAARTPPRSAAARMASTMLFEAVPMYAGLTLEELGGNGRALAGPRAGRRAARAATAPDTSPPPPRGRSPRRPRSRLAVGSYRSIWAAPEVAASPALAFLHPRQRVEISPPDAERLKLADGAEMAIVDESRDRDPRAGRAARRRPRRQRLPPARARARQRRVARRLDDRDRPAPRPAAAPPPEALAPAGRRRRPRAGRGGFRVILGLETYYEPWWIQIIKSLLIFAVALGILPLIIVYERKLLGRFQGRYGPNRVGPFGLLQPLAEIVKFATKEDSRPVTSIGPLYVFAPVISILTAVAAFALVPVRRRHATSSERASGSTASTPRSARSTCSRSARSPSTG